MAVRGTPAGTTTCSPTHGGALRRARDRPARTQRVADWRPRDPSTVANASFLKNSRDRRCRIQLRINPLRDSGDSLCAWGPTCHVFGRNARSRSSTRQFAGGRVATRYAEPMEQFRRGELVFDVIDAGPADGPVVVLLHGFPEQNTMWQSIISRLTAQGYRCLAPRQRGYSPGARPTRRRDYRISELAEDVRTLIDASGAQRVHLVGHDWGATVAWRVAQQFPDRLLTVTSMSVPHPGAFLKALVTSRQGLASWYIYFFQLPRIPEWYMTRGRGTFTLSGFAESRAQHAPALAEAEAKAMAEPGALTAALNWYRAIPLSDLTRHRQEGHRPDDVRLE